jgi:hypothetical protein
MSFAQTTLLTTRMAWRLLRLADEYEATSLKELLPRLEPDAIRYTRKWEDAERIRKVSALLTRAIPVSMGTCFKLALIRYEQMRRLGFNVTLHLGVRPSPEGISGHAWLTLNGLPLWEEEQHVATFRETYRYPTLSEWENERMGEWPSTARTGSKRPPKGGQQLISGIKPVRT